MHVPQVLGLPTQILPENWKDFLAEEFKTSGAFGSRRLLKALISRNRNALSPDQIFFWIRYGQRFSENWWEPRLCEHAVLRRSNASDADFYRDAFGNSRFSTLYNRQQPWRGDLTKALSNSYSMHFEDTGTIHWTVLNRDHRPMGLASLSNFSKENGRAEISLGFPYAAPARAIMAASMLLLQFTFSVAKLNKLTSYVYEENIHARNFTKNFGFTHEGFLEEHFLLPPHGFVGVNIFGLTRKQLQNNDRLRQFSIRLGVGEPINQKLDPMLWINND